MQKQLTHRNIETLDALCRFTGRLLAELQTRRRPGRIAFPLPRREACLTRRAKIGAMREAELNDWLTGDDDFTGAMHQPVA